jgi:hypothetical protein
MTPDQAGDVRSLARAAGISPTVTKVDPMHPLLAELSGPIAPKIAPRPPRPEDIAAARQRPGQPGRRRGQAAGTSARSGVPRSGGRPGARNANGRNSSGGRRSGR